METLLPPPVPLLGELISVPESEETRNSAPYVSEETYNAAGQIS
jgi:hypothetical protein